MSVPRSQRHGTGTEIEIQIQFEIKLGLRFCPQALQTPCGLRSACAQSKLQEQSELSTRVPDETKARRLRGKEGHCRASPPAESQLCSSSALRTSPFVREYTLISSRIQFSSTLHSQSLISNQVFVSCLLGKSCIQTSQYTPLDAVMRKHVLTEHPGRRRPPRSFGSPRTSKGS